MLEKLVKNIAVILILSIFYFNFLNAKKKTTTEFHEKCEKKSMGHSYANYFNKAYIVSYRNMPKKEKKSPFNFLAKPPLKLK